MLYCFDPGDGPQVPTKIASVWDLLDQLSDDELNYCLKRKFMFTHTYDVYGTSKVDRPILSFEDGQLVLRYSENLFLRGETSPEVEAPEGTPRVVEAVLMSICSKIAAFCATLKNQIPVTLNKGDALLVNNLEHLHWRDTPAPDGRYLKRFWLN